MNTNQQGYRKVKLTNVRTWTRSNEHNAIDWLGRFSVDGVLVEPYPIESIPLVPEFIEKLYVIIKPDGSIWREGSFYLYNRCIEGANDKTCSNIAGDLSNYMNILHGGGRHFLDFEGPQSQRPTYFYKSELKKLIIDGGIKRPTANRKISSVIGLYRFMTEVRHFIPQQPMWKASIRSIVYLDRHGNSHSKQIVKTDLTFKNSAAIGSGDYIEDGGKLYPIERDNQRALIKVLVLLQNTEMLLIYIVALTTGMRIQSVLTLRFCMIDQEQDEKSQRLLPLTIGPGTLTDTKMGKSQTVLVPGWVHHALTQYINSERYKGRAEKSLITSEENQYVFFTRSGRPYYIAKCDSKLYGFSDEDGSAIRAFQRNVHKKLRELGHKFSFRFHDLRATFGMNLVEDNMKYLAEGKMNQLQLLDLVKTRMCHSSIEVSMRYLRFRHDHELVALAQSEFEEHLRSMIDNLRDCHERERS